MIDFAAVNHAPVKDFAGRTFNWTHLRRKTIYLTGHGFHIFSDGYCLVPNGTTIHFYQTYGKLFNGARLIPFIRGEEKWEPDAPSGAASPARI